MSFTKIDLAEQVANELKLSKSQAMKFIELIFEIIKKTLEIGENVKISGFGNFEVRKKNARIGRNPKTKEEYTISARNVVTFKPGPKLKAKINS